MLVLNPRFLLAALLGLSLAACSMLSPKEASAPQAAPQADSTSRAEPVDQVADAQAPAPVTPSVVVVLDGPRSAAMRKKVERMLAEHYRIVPTAKYRRTARRLRARKMRNRDVARVASKIGADAVLHGVVRRKGKRRFRLAVSLHDGTTGKSLKRFTLPLGSRKLRKPAQRELAGKLRPALDELGASTVVASHDAPAAGQERTAQAPARDQGERKPVQLRSDARGQIIDDEVPPSLH